MYNMNPKFYAKKSGKIESCTQIITKVSFFSILKVNVSKAAGYYRQRVIK